MKRSGCVASAASVSASIDDVVEAMIAPGRRCSHARAKASRFASMVSVTPSKSTSAEASAAGAWSSATMRMRSRILAASLATPKPARSARLEAISALASAAMRAASAAGRGLKSMMSTE
jgi:hypothetical protein